MRPSSDWSFRDASLPRLWVESGPYPKVRVVESLCSNADEIFYNVMRHYSSKQLHQVYSLDGKSGVVDTNSRYTHSYPLAASMQAAELTTLMNEAVRLYTSTEFASFSSTKMVPQLLGYEERCQFRLHCDNSIWKGGAWNRNDKLRDVTGILYLSDPVDYVTKPNQYSGGDLSFPNIVDPSGSHMTLRPKKGTMVIFPSSPAYQHQVSIITAGYRLAVVNWWSLSS